MTKQRNLWEDAYEKCIAIAEPVDNLTNLLRANGQEALADHIYTIFLAIPQAVAIQTPKAARERIAQRIAEEQQAEFEAWVQSLGGPGLEEACESTSPAA